MAELQYLHGVETVEVDDGIRPIQTVKSAIIGIVGVADNADPDEWPLNEPILIAGNPRKLATLGATGSLVTGLTNIFRVARPTIVAVRIAAGTNVDATIKMRETLTNIIGAASTKTGIHALRKSNAKLKLVPKLICVPDYTAFEPTDGVASITVNTAGTMYTPDKVTATFTGGGTADGMVLPTAKVVVNGTGGVQAVVILTPGYGMTEAPVLTLTRTDGVTGGTDASTTVVMGTVKNPVVAELEGLLPQLRAYGIVQGPTTSYEASVAFRDKIDSDRIMVLDGGAQYWDPIDMINVMADGAPFAVAMQALTDEKDGFHHSFSNRSVPGVIGVNRPIDWSFYDSNVEGQLLNSQSVTVMVHDSGFRFMGVRSATTKSLWKFMAVRRTADMVYESIEQAMREAVDKPIGVGLLDWIQSSVNMYLRSLARRGIILGGKCWLDPTLNTPDQMVNGKVTFDFDIEPPAPLERLTFRAHRNPDYYEELVAQFVRQAA